MIGEKEIQRYRQKTLEEKLREFDSLMEVAFAVLDSLPIEERRRRWDLWARRDEEDAARLAERLGNLPR
jgi:hypothetical protein